MQAGEVAERQRLGLEVPAHLGANLLAAWDALGHRRRPEPERRCDPGEDLGAHPLVACALSLLGSALPRLAGGSGLGLVPAQPRLEAPGTAEAGVIVEALEDRHDARDRAGGLFDAAL